MLYGVLFFIIAGCGPILIIAKRDIWRRHLERILEKVLIAKQADASAETPLLNTFLLRNIVNKMLRKKNDRRYAAAGDGKRLIRKLYKYGMKVEAEFLAAIFAPSAGKTEDTNPNDTAGIILQAQLAARNADLDKAAEILTSMPEAKLPLLLEAEKMRLLAQIALKNGDLQQASQNMMLAARFFQKKRAFAEEAYAYLELGIIYRAAAVEDVAHFMFATALKIFEKMRINQGIADTAANLGMLWVMNEKFDDAAKYFAKSLKINHKLKRQAAGAYVLTQAGLAALLQHNYNKAYARLKYAIRIQEKILNFSGAALAYEILAYAAYENKNWEQLKKYTAKAAPLYWQEKNIAAFLETDYLAAWAENETGEIEAAEKRLRKLIDLALKSESCFYIGNAYNLLGLILLKKNQPERAKAIFLQSAAREQKDERFGAAATDYHNIALIEYKKGDIGQALKTFQTALEYALVCGDRDILQILEHKIAELKAELK